MAALLHATLLGILALCQTQTAPRPDGHGFTLRVQNTQYGPIEASSDGGAHFAIVGRVLQPANGAALLTPPPRPGDRVVSFLVGPNRFLILRAAESRPAADPAVIHTDIEPGDSIFGRLQPRPGTRLFLSTDAVESPLPAGYAPSSGDTLLAHSPAAENVVASLITAAARAYAARSAARAKRYGWRITSGTLPLEASVPEKDLKPIEAVTYSIDGVMIAAQNTPPWKQEWDTRTVPDGEHVVEIAALDGAGSVMTRARALVVTQNAVAAPGTTGHAPDRERVPAPSGALRHLPPRRA